MSRQETIILFLFVGVVVFLIFLGISLTVEGAQFGTNFKFSNLTEMKDDGGWTLIHESGISLPEGGGVILSGEEEISTIAHYNIPTGVYDWKVEVIGIWLGGGGHSWIEASVFTERHSYTWAANGASGAFEFYRDGQQVPAEVSELFGRGGYNEQANTPLQLDMERHGRTMFFYVNSEQIRTYIETDTELSRVVGVSISSPPASSVKYTYAGAFIPEPSSSGPVNPVPPEVDENPPPPPVVETNPQSPTQDIPPPPYPQFYPPPITSPDPTDPTAPEYPTGPVDQPADPPLQSPPTTLVIMVNPGTYTINTEPAKINDGAQLEAELFLINGIPSAWVSDPEAMANCATQQAMYDAGMIAPESHIFDFEPFAGKSVGYYVTVNTHVSGDLYNPNTAGSAVAIINAQITDSTGKVVYEARITATSSQGKTLDQLHMQAATGITTFFQNLMNQNK